MFTVFDLLQRLHLTDNNEISMNTYFVPELFIFQEAIYLNYMNNIMDNMTPDNSSDEDDPYANFAGRLKGNIFSLFMNSHVLVRLQKAIM